MLYSKIMADFVRIDVFQLINSRKPLEKSENIGSLESFLMGQSMEQQDSASKLKEPIFSRKKALLTVGQYAVRQGVSAGIVQECARLGIVQVRKHKNKTFIVDLPLDAYRSIKQLDSDSPEPVDSANCANKITELVNRIFQPAAPVRQHSESDNETQLLSADSERTESKKIGGLKTVEINPASAEMSLPQHRHKGPAAIPDLKLFAEEENKVFKSANRRDLAKGGAADRTEPEPGRFRIPFLRNITDSIRAVSVWKLSFVLVTAAFVISICAYARVSFDRKIQQQKLREAYESINKLMTKYEDAIQKTRLYEFDLMSWQSEAEQSKKALISSETELQNARKQLYEAEKDLQTTQQYNTEKLKELNDQISKIRSHLPNLSGQAAE